MTPTTSDDETAITTFKSVISAFLNATYRSIFRTNAESAVIIKHVMETSLSNPVERIGDRILMVCILFNRIKSLLTLSRHQGEGSTSDDDPQFCFSPSPSPDPFSMSGPSLGSGKPPTIVICRVCEREVPLELINEHSQSCVIAYQSSQVMKNSDDRMSKLIADTERAVLDVPWPGKGETALSFLIPVLHVIALLERAANIDPDSAGAYDEITDIDDCLSLIQIPKKGLASELHATALSLVHEKLSATASLSAALDVTKKTVTKKASKNSRMRLETVVSDFQFINTISSGAYARVFLARKKKTGDIYAIKAIPKERTIQKNEIQSVMTEKDILLRLVSPYMIRFYYSIIGNHNLYIVMEYMPGGDLYSVLHEVGRFREKDARIYTVQVVAALEFLRQNNIIHRDLKPDNILVSREGRLKLADFGLSFYGMVDRSVTTEHLESPKAVGTPDYMAPEIIWQQRHSFSADYWSLGCIIYEFLVCTPPFHEDTPQDTFARIVKGDFSKAELKGVSPEAVDLISKLLVTDPSQRLGDKSIEEIKAHPWFNGIDWDRIQDLEPPFVPQLASAEDTSYFESRYKFGQGDPQDVAILDDIESSKNRKDSRSFSSVGTDDGLDSDDGISCFPSVSIDSLKDATIETANKLLTQQRATSFCGTEEQPPNSHLLPSHSFDAGMGKVAKPNTTRRARTIQRHASTRDVRAAKSKHDSGTKSDDNVC